MLFAALAGLVTLAFGAPAAAQDATPAVPVTTTTTTAPTPPPPTLDDIAAIASLVPTSVAGPGVYGAPTWLPLRRDLSGAEIKVGCTYQSRGSQFGYACGGHHDRWAIDFIAESGTPVYAAGAGFATDLSGQPGGSGFGNVVRIDHGLGISTIYAHLTDAMVPAEGEWVDETTQIGTVGSTGSSSTPHLHYEKFAVPTPDTDIGDQVSVDPGSLHACRAGVMVSFPEVAGFDSWKGLAWGSLTAASDGNGCVPEPEADADAEPVDGWSALIAGLRNRLS